MPSYSSVSRGSVIVVDAILLVITWHTLARRPMHMMHFPKSRMETISNILLWNGTQYFIVLFILNVLHISFTLTSITNFTNDGSRSPSLMTQFAYPLTCILTYRFILDLQAANQHNVRIGSDDPELQTSMDSQSSLSFVNRAIGSLASTIVPGSSAAGDEGESLTEEESQSSNTPGQSRNSATTALQH
ncbi:hypothetical protein C8Q80DRAFT_167686 [Daedaleopsis nitida]|nr:hypothetical protein C8Q80DRAFT_167686 [Daedaleopsis nitida]